VPGIKDGRKGEREKRERRDKALLEPGQIGLTSEHWIALKEKGSWRTGKKPKQ
jgi:hypothetical protein